MSKSPNQIIEERKARYAANKETAKRQALTWTAANREKHREAVKRYRAKNPEIKRAEKAKRRAAILGGGGTHTAKDVRSLLASQRWRCVYCKGSIRDSHEVDHIVPLALGGSNDKTNLQMLCGTCNRQKGADHPVDFAQRVGLLL